MLAKNIDLYKLKSNRLSIYCNNFIGENSIQYTINPNKAATTLLPTYHCAKSLKVPT